MDKIQTADGVDFWLQWQTWPDVKSFILRWGDQPYIHPYGFTVVRLRLPYIAGWQARVHFWEYTDPQTDALKIHCHGAWRLHSRVLLGNVVETKYLFEPSTLGSFNEYVVTKSNDNMRSKLESTGLTADLLSSEAVIRGSQSGVYAIARDMFHSTEPHNGKLAVTLAATETSDFSEKSRIMCMERRSNLRFSNEPVESINDLLVRADAEYLHETHPADRWASFVFVSRRDRVLMARPRRNPDIWMPIGGRGAAYENKPIETAIRELDEEISVKAEPASLRYIGKRLRDVGTGYTYFWALDLSTESAPVHDPVELQEARWFSFDEISRLDLHEGTASTLDDLQEYLRTGR